MTHLLKTFTILIFISISCYSQVQTGWYWVNPYPSGSWLNDIQYLNATTIIAVGSAGTIVRSTNAGSSWQTIRISTFNSLERIQFLNQNTGYVSGDSSILLKTTDAGNNWIRLPYISGYNGAGLCFLDVNTGFISSFNTIEKTTDGGQTFNSISTLGNYPYEIKFLNENTGYFSTNSSVYKTTNQGLNWSSILSGLGASAHQLYFVDINTGYVSNDTSVLETTNGGLNWFSCFGGSSNQVLSIKFLNSSFGIITGRNELIKKTTNGGLVWSDISYTVSNDISSVSFFDPSNLVIGSDYSMILKSSNAGSSWLQMSSGSVGSFKGISMSDANTGFAIQWRGNYGNNVVKTVNGGDSWSEISGIFPDYLYSIAFVNSLTGFVGSDQGRILKTQNGGLNWSTINYGSSTITDICFPASSVGIFVTQLGEFYRTTNVGQTWQLVYNDNAGSPCKLCFIDQNTGFAIATQLLKTSNSGVNWIPLTNPIASGNTTCLYFVDANTGFLGTINGQVSKTTNGGINWQTNSVSQYVITSLKFVNANTGYFTGSGNIGGVKGVLSKTIDGGVSWNRQNLPSNWSLLNLTVLNSNSLLACGDAGTIIKTTTGGEYIGVEKVGSEIPARHFLLRNFPNPFNPNTTIRFDISNQHPEEKTRTQILIYDVMGKLISIMVDQYLGPGSYKIQWNAQNFPSGVYFCTLRVGEFSQTEKIVLLK